MGVLLRPANERWHLAGAIALSLIGHVVALAFSWGDGTLGLSRFPNAGQRLAASIVSVGGHSAVSASGGASSQNEPSGATASVLSQDRIVSRYVVPDLLTTRPAPLEPVQIPDPETTIFTGQVILRVYVGVLGDVDQVEVLDSMLPDNYVHAAIQAIKQQRFLPGRIGGKAVPTFTDIEIEFNPPE